MKAWPPFPGRVELAAAVMPLVHYLGTAGWSRSRSGVLRVPMDTLELDGEASPATFLLGERDMNEHMFGSTLGRALTVAFRFGVEQGRRIAGAGARDEDALAVRLGAVRAAQLDAAGLFAALLRTATALTGERMTLATRREVALDLAALALAYLEISA